MVAYEFYKSTYHGGSIPAEEWPALEREAAAQLARYKRIYTVATSETRGEDMAVCAMAEALYNAQLVANGEGGAVQSASIGSVSVGYGSAAAQAVDVTPAGVARALWEAASLYLDIYRGVV